jgi:hypothetical protein
VPSVIRINDQPASGLPMSQDAILSPALDTFARGWRVADVARRYRVGEDKVRSWIMRGELAAVNTAESLCGRPRWVILPDALAAFETKRAGGPPPTPPRRRRRPALIDYYAD